MPIKWVGTSGVGV